MARQRWTARAYLPTGWIFAITLTSVIACDGGGNLAPVEFEVCHVSGVVQSASTGQPLEGATVEALRAFDFDAQGNLRAMASGATNAAGKFELTFQAEKGSNCGIGLLWAEHAKYVGDGIAFIAAPFGEIVIKLQPGVKAVSIVPAAANVPLGGTQLLVGDVLFWDDSRRTGAVSGSWKSYAGPERGSITTSVGEQTTYVAPSSMPSAPCDMAPPGHVWIYYSVASIHWAKSDITLQP